MKHLAALFLATALPACSLAQWSTDPAAPLVVCNAANAQTGVKALPDGSGGWYTFWLDKRVDATNAQVYGQRYDAEGIAQWTANGKPLLTPVGESVSEFVVVPLDNGNVLMAYLHRPAVYQDTLSAMAFDADGDPVWAQATHITQSGSPVLGLDNLRAIASPGGAIIGWYDTYFGGSNGVNCTRIRNNGNLPWGADGYAIPNATYGPFELYDDGARGAIVQWRTGNGSGAHLYAMRVDSTGANAWAANANTSAGGTGLNYAFSSISGAQYELITAWRNMPGNLDMARLDTNAVLAWGTEPTVLCNYTSSQDAPVLCAVGGQYVAAWADNRPPAANADVYVQRFNGNGQLQWATAGLPGIQASSYIPTPGVVPGNSGAVIVTMDAGNPGFCAQRILSSGSQAWPAPTAFCTNAFNPFYGDQVKLSDGAGGVVAFWSNQNEVYAARIYENGDLGNHVGMADASTRVDRLRILPSPTTGPLSVEVPTGDQVRTVRVLDAQGRATTLPQLLRTSDRLQLDAFSLAPGLYVLELGTDGGMCTGRFMVER